MPNIEFTSKLTVELLGQYGKDLDVVRSALVSSNADRAREEITFEKTKGLINSLMKQRHGCYDAETEVLTTNGWRKWEDVTENDVFATINLETNKVEWQKAQRLIRKMVDEPLVRVKKNSVDLLVTQEHNMLVEPYIFYKNKERKDKKASGYWGEPTFVRAKDLLNVSFRIRKNGAEHVGRISYDNTEMLFVGFTLGDGHVTPYGRVDFHLKSERKIEYLRDLCSVLGYTMSENGDSYSVRPTSVDVREWCLATYDENRDRVIPQNLLLHADKRSLLHLLSGLFTADGRQDPRGHMSISTVSLSLAEGLEELAFICGTTAYVGIRTNRESSYGTRPLYVVQIRQEKSLRPRVGWTKKERSKEVTLEHYQGYVYCATVPNGTLYVRRNGQSCWCGNSPFESGYFEFWIDAPRAVRDEHVRHRIGSYSSSSLRYNHGEARLYVPPRHRPLKEVEGFKKMNPKYEPLSEEAYKTYAAKLEEGYTASYKAYGELVELGYTSTESTRWITHDGKMTPYIARFNPRNLMAFLSLRTHSEEANHISFPMWEINEIANKIEYYFKYYYPLTWEAWNTHGREAP